MRHKLKEKKSVAHLENNRRLKQKNFDHQNLIASTEKNYKL